MAQDAYEERFDQDFEHSSFPGESKMANLDSEIPMEDMGIYSVGRLGEAKKDWRDEKPSNFSKIGTRSHRNDYGAERDQSKRGGFLDQPR